jgi:hypothetical protein
MQIDHLLREAIGLLSLQLDCLRPLWPLNRVETVLDRLYIGLSDLRSAPTFNLYLM